MILQLTFIFFFCMIFFTFANHFKFRHTLKLLFSDNLFNLHPWSPQKLPFLQLLDVESHSNCREPLTLSFSLSDNKEAFSSICGVFTPITGCYATQERKQLWSFEQLKRLIPPHLPLVIPTPCTFNLSAARAAKSTGLSEGCLTPQMRTVVMTFSADDTYTDKLFVHQSWNM